VRRATCSPTGAAAARSRTLGATRFSVAAGKRRFVRVRLPRGTCRLLAGRATTSVKAVIALRRAGLPSLALRRTVVVRGRVG
jgi:hypothetical protein